VQSAPRNSRKRWIRGKAPRTAKDAGSRTDGQGVEKATDDLQLLISAKNNARHRPSLGAGTAVRNRASGRSLTRPPSRSCLWMCRARPRTGTAGRSCESPVVAVKERPRYSRISMG